ncbi:hypothetical protein CC78DRAFT_548718 [Lojkania enalia]|uniref:Uncharacterized protein n=1 Tax=Lojkania enalia TaxID=147567 RepID=A0A9P4JZZ6_9PLEO|nr:hypothetical protein CC78DRAFT_548718 [Didymosphaeria enalia]
MAFFFNGWVSYYQCGAPRIRHNTNSFSISQPFQGISPVPTEAPYLPGIEDDSSRQDLRRLAARQRNPGVCAYIDGIEAYSLTCQAGNSCAVNQFGAAGCCPVGNAAGCYLPTTCIPYTSMEYCGSNCMYDPYALKCGYMYPECGTIEIHYPDGTYYNVYCGAMSTEQTALASFTDGAGGNIVTPVEIATPTKPPASGPVSGPTAPVPSPFVINNYNNINNTDENTNNNNNNNGDNNVNQNGDGNSNNQKNGAVSWRASFTTGLSVVFCGLLAVF